MTILHHWPTHPWRNTSSCHCQTCSSPARTANLHSPARPLPTQGPSILGRESPTTNPQWAAPFGTEHIRVPTGNGVLVLSNYVEVTLPQLAEPTPADPHCSHSHSCSHNTQAHPRGPCWQPMVEIDQPPPREETSLLLHPKRWCCSSLNISPHAPHPGLWRLQEACGGEHSLWVVVGVSAGEDEESYKAVGSSIMATRLFWHPTLGEKFIDMITCMLSVMDLGVDPQQRSAQSQPCRSNPIQAEHSAHHWQLFAHQPCWTDFHLACSPQCFNRQSSSCLCIIV